MFLGGPAGLFEYDADGKLLAAYRVGFELPASPLAELKVSTAAGAPELLISTHGEGLLIFDGRGFRQVRPDLPDCRTITAMLPLSTGHVLLGTAKHGLLVYDGRALAPFHPALSGLHITALAGDASDLWVGTLDRGVYYWHAGQADNFSEAEGLPDPQVLSLITTGDKTYVGTPDGIAEFTAGKLTRRLADGVFARALLSSGQTLLAGTMDEGTWEIPLAGSQRGSPRSRGEPLSTPVQQLFAGDDALYAVGRDGLYRMNPGRQGWNRVLGGESALLTDRDVSALAVDASGKLWVGYFDRGLDMVEPGLRHVEHVENDHVFCVNRIVPDARRGLVAVATANGLVMFDRAGTQRQILGRADGLIADHVTDVALSSTGMVLATAAGLTFMDSSGLRSLYAFHGLINNHVYALGVSGDRLLAGTLGGISVLDGGVIRASYTTANAALKQNWITAIVPVGEEWFVGTYGAGVQRLDAGGRFQSFPDATGPFEVNPNAMLVTAQHVFAGTLGSGLYVYSRGNGRWTQVTTGLPSANVTAIAAAGGYVYVGTDNGLVRITEQDLSF